MFEAPLGSRLHGGGDPTTVNDVLVDDGRRHSVTIRPDGSTEEMEDETEVVDHAGGL